MKNIYKFLIGALLLGFTSCSEDFITIDPQSYITEEAFFKNAIELNVGLNGCYAGMRRPIEEEWKFTELRSDNALMNQLNTTSPDNLVFLSYDAFFIDANDTGVKDLWFYSYVNIKNTNILLNKMNVNYSGGAIVYGANSIDATAADIKDIASQATFLRAYHYFNLVRLWGDVFLVHEPISPVEASNLNRVNKSQIYDLIIADLLSTIANGSVAKFSATANGGRANAWSAKALLAKVYLTLGRKSEALPLLSDIIANSGYGLEASYANIFSTATELTKEILFTIRFKSGNVGLGSRLTGDFAPAAHSRNAANQLIFVTGNQGDNAPSQELYDSFNTSDIRRGYIRESSDASLPRKLFYTKYWSLLTVRNDADNDFPIIRYADVLLMYAEAAGSANPNTLNYINLVRTRAGLTGSNQLTTTDIDTPAKFDRIVANERRWEFTAENHRWFDIVRYGTTLPTLNAVDIMENHFTIMDPLLYSLYTSNAESVVLTTILERVNTDRLLLPIPLIEIDTNNKIDISQNPGYN